MSSNRATQSQVLKSAFLEFMKGVSTCIPGHVLTFDPVTQRAVVQIGIERVDVGNVTVRPPPIVEVPVLFPGGLFCVEYEINRNDEGLILFSQRCIDGWLQSGGVAPNPIGRFHNLSDALFIPGFRPQSSAITSFQNNGIRLRNKAGSQFAWLKNDGSIHIGNGAGSIVVGVDGVVTINGAKIPTDGDVITSNNISLNTHRHSGVQPGSGTSGGPVA